MDSQKPPSSPHPKSSDKKLPQQSGNFVWYLLGLGVLLLLMVTIFNSRNETRIRMSDFVKLVKASNPETHPEPERTATSTSRIARASRNRRSGSPTCRGS